MQDLYSVCVKAIINSCQTIYAPIITLLYHLPLLLFMNHLLQLLSPAIARIYALAIPHIITQLIPLFMIQPLLLFLY